jgi:hypothetical protein
MAAREALRRCVRVVRAGLRRAGARLGGGGRALAERLAYRPREVLVVALLAGGVLGGLGVERWQHAHPDLAERLEAEPARPAPPALVAATSSPRRGRTAAPDRCGGARAGAGPAGDAGVPPGRLDLNRASAGELARLAGIPWRAAARLVAARRAFGTDPDGGETPPRRARPWRAGRREGEVGTAAAALDRPPGAAGGDGAAAAPDP